MKPTDRQSGPLMSEATRLLSAIEQGDPHAAEQLLPLVSRKKLPPNDWFTADTESRLGACLLAQKRFAEAESHLLQGYRGLLAAAGTPPVTSSWPIRCLGSLHDSPGAPPIRIKQARARLISLYKAWGKRDQAARWQATPPNWQ